jgi:hypothetical protein
MCSVENYFDAITIKGFVQDGQKECRFNVHGIFDVYKEIRQIAFLPTFQIRATALSNAGGKASNRLLVHGLVA